MALNSILVAKVTTPNSDNGKPTIGTAYPIRQGVIITACHVVPDLNNPSKTCLQWRRDDEEVPSLEKPLTKILYYNKDYDILIAECEKTPKNTPDIKFQSSYPSTIDDHWESHGYARSGKQEETETRNKESSSGRFQASKNDHPIQKLILTSKLSDPSLWKGMSGAPVFLADKNIISAIITNTPDKDGAGNPIQEDCLYSISIPYLFENLPSEEKDKFFKALGLDACKTAYLEKQKELLKKLIERIQSKHPRFVTALKDKFVDCSNGITNLSEGLINYITSNAPDFIQAYRLICEDHIDSVNSKSRDDMKLLLLLLLAQLSSKHPKRTISLYQHLHQLDVSTQILTELIIASHYGASPKLLKTENSDVLGEDVHISSQKEVGWDSEEEAKEQIKSFATQVYKKSYQPDKNPDWVSLNDFLDDRRQGRNARIDRYEIEMNIGKGYPLLDKAVTDKIEKLVSNLIIVQFGNSENINKKESDEASKIKARLRSFFDMLNTAS